MIICPFAPYGLAHGPKTCQLCHKLGPHFAERISLKLLDGLAQFKVSWTCLDLYLCNVIVIGPFTPYGLAHGPKTFQIRQHKFWKCFISGMEGPFDMERKGCESIGCYTHFVTFNVPLTHDLDLGFSRSNFEKSHILGMGWPIDMELKGCELRECWTHVVTFNVHLTRDLDLGFPWSNFEKVLSYEWDGQLTWNHREGCESIECWPMLWLSMFTPSMTLTLDFQGQIMKNSYLRNGMTDWHGAKGMWVDKMLDSHCDFKLWPHPWPWPWIFKVKYWNCCNSGMGGLTHLEWKGCELDMMLDAQWDWPWATVHDK